ncbi:WD40-repeat-containing domain protein [Naematelia encephala]|uniref:WD40-repeat-containing domain protein n=1 Tax=Naematelia encephala TaxID=71784 RepID=A0A1Y2AL77_9TREE|nr:WD40-repeat-containing domain protein [Naematelia encephala]
MSLSYLQQESTPLHPDAIWALTWTRLNHLISGCADGHLRIWDSAALSQPIHDIPSHPLAITSLSTSEDGTRALAASLDGTIACVDVQEGRVIGKCETGREKVAGENEIPAYAVGLHPNNKCWAWSGRSSKLAVRQMNEEVEANGHGVGQGPLSGETSVIDTGKSKFGMDLKFSPDGQQLALASESGQIIVVDTTTQSIISTYTSHAMAVRTLSWSPDSQWLFSGSDDHRIVLHDVRAGSKTGSGGKGEGAVAIMQGHQSWVLKVAASPDGKLLGSGGADHLIKLWEVGQRACVSTSTSTAEVWGLDWQPAGANTFAVGKQFAAAGDDRAVILYRAAGSA